MDTNTWIHVADALPRRLVIQARPAANDEGMHLGALPCGLMQAIGAVRLLLCNSPESRLYPVSDTSRELVGPLVHRLVCDANGLGGGGNRPAEEFNGLIFKHESN